VEAGARPAFPRPAPGAHKSQCFSVHTIKTIGRVFWGNAFRYTVDDSQAGMSAANIPAQRPGRSSSLALRQAAGSRMQPAPDQSPPPAAGKVETERRSARQLADAAAAVDRERAHRTALAERLNRQGDAVVARLGGLAAALRARPRAAAG